MTDRKDLVERLRAEADGAGGRPGPTPDTSAPARSDPNGFRAVVHMMTGTRVGGWLGWWAISAIPAAIALGVALDRGMPILGVLLAALFISIVPVILLVALVRFFRYRGWREELPFPLGGEIDALAGDRSDSHTWRSTRIAVDVGRPEDAETVGIALRALCARANDRFYETDPGPKLSRWQVEGCVARGDANVRVAWTIYRFVAGDLRALAEAGVRIERVSMQVEAEGRYVGTRPSSDPSYYD